MAACGSACCHHNFAASIDRPDAEAVFISCGASSLEIVDELEDKLGKPVICSNQAMLWDCLRRAGIADQFSGYGRLLHHYCPCLFLSVGIKTTKIFEQVGIAKNIIESLTASGWAGLRCGRSFSLNILLK